MSTPKLASELTEAIGNYVEQSPEKLADYQRAIERFNYLESKGLLQKRGNTLLPIEERYKLNVLYQNDK